MPLMEKLPRRLQSRKLWVALGTAGFAILTDVLGFPIDEQTYWTVLSAGAIYIASQGYVDGKEKEGDLDHNKKA
jgi:hypothetical protein